MTLSKKLKLLRSNRGLSLDQLAEQTGLNMTTLSNYETGFRTPGRNNIARLAQFYGVSVDYLLDVPKQDDNSLPDDIAVMFKSTDWRRLSPEEQDTVRRVIKAAIGSHAKSGE